MFLSLHSFKNISTLFINSLLFLRLNFDVLKFGLLISLYLNESVTLIKSETFIFPFFSNNNDLNIINDFKSFISKFFAILYKNSFMFNSSSNDIEFLVIYSDVV